MSRLTIGVALLISIKLAVLPPSRALADRITEISMKQLEWRVQ